MVRITDVCHPHRRPLADSAEPAGDVVLGLLARAGWVNIWSVGPASISRPWKKNAVRSETRAACCMLCVTMTIV